MSTTYSGFDFIYIKNTYKSPRNGGQLQKRIYVKTEVNIKKQEHHCVALSMRCQTSLLHGFLTQTPCSINSYNADDLIRIIKVI